MKTFQKMQAWISVVLFLFLFPVAIFSQSWVQHANTLLPGSVTALFSSGTEIYAGTFGEGLFISTNNGSSWTNIKSNLPNSSIKTIYVNDTDIFLGMNYYGVIKSSDGGAEWTALNAGLSNRYVQSLANLDSWIFAGTMRGGVYRTTNNGASWLASSDGMPMNTDIRTLITRGTMLYAGTESGVYISADSAITWTASNTGLTTVDVTTIISRGGTIFAGTNGGGVFISTNGGHDWSAVNNGLTNYNVTSLVASGTILFAGTSGGIYISTNDGNSWTLSNSGISNLAINCLLALGANVYAGTGYGPGGGIYVTTNNGTSWSAANNGLNNYSKINAYAILGSNLFAACEGGVVMSSNSGATWSIVSNGLSTNIFVNSVTVYGNNLLIGTEGNGSFVSTNSGANWSQINNGFHSTPKIRTILVNNSILYAASDSGLYISTNGGSSWSASNSGLTNKNIVSLAYVDTLLFAGTSTGLFMSVNNGATWTASGTGLPTIQISSIVNISQNIFISTEGSGVYKSVNFGGSWQSVNTGLNELFVRNLLVDGTNIYAATWYGVYVTVNNGAEWVQIFNTGLSNTNIQSLFVINNTLLAGTIGSGMFNLDISALLLIGQLQKSAYCTTNQLPVPVMAIGTFNTGNIFTAELSDSLGDFTNPMDIGQLNSTNSGYLTATIPSIAEPGSKYRIRVRSSSPNMTSPDNNKDFTIHLLPAVTLLPLDSICASAAPISLTGGAPEGGTYTGLGVSNGKFNPGQAGPGTHSITYTFTDPNGCTNSATNTIKVLTVPDVTMDSLHPVCVYEADFILTGGLPTGGTYSGPGVSNGIFRPALAGSGIHTIKYTVMGSNGCSGSASKTIKVNPKPNVILTNFQDVCLDTPAFDLTGGSPAGGTYSGNGIINGKFYPALAGNGSHKITYSYKDANGCEDTLSRTIHVYPMPERPGITRGGDELAASAAIRYQWYFKDVAIDGAVNQYFSPDKVGFYTVRIWDTFGCTAISDPFYFDGTGVFETIEFSDGLVYPNPSDGKITIKFNKDFSGVCEFTIKDIFGNEVSSNNGRQISGLYEVIDISELSTGIYFMNLYYSEKNHIVKIIKK